MRLIKNKRGKASPIRGKKVLILGEIAATCPDKSNKSPLAIVNGKTIKLNILMSVFKFYFLLAENNFSFSLAVKLS